MPPKPGYRRKNYSREPSKNKAGPKHVEPFSPWQLLIESARVGKFSLGQLGKKTGIARGTLFNWVRAKSGCPPYTSYDRAKNDLLAEVLGRSSQDLWEAYQKALDSQPPSLPRAARTAKSSLGEVSKLHQLLGMIHASKKKSFSLDEIRLLIAVVANSDG